MSATCFISLTPLFRTPFLGQGANQAIQDAFCLATLIAKVNYDEPLLMGHLFKLQEGLFPRYPMLNVAVNHVLRLWFWLFNSLSVARGWRPTRLQTMAYEYEAIRKFPTALIILGGRLMATVIALRGWIGVFLKVLFFRVLQLTGLGRLLFVIPMRPVV